jgi:hypothetical protein
MVTHYVDCHSFDLLSIGGGGNDCRSDGSGLLFKSNQGENDCVGINIHMY